MDYSCTFINRRGRPGKVLAVGTLTPTPTGSVAGGVNVYEFGRLMLTIPPAEERVVESFDPRVTYSRFSKIVFYDDRVEVKLNPDWEMPEDWKDQFVTEFLNEDGAEIEALYLGAQGPLGPPEFFPKGIPRLVPLPISHPLAKFKKVTWQIVKEKTPDKNNPNFLTWSTRLEMAREPRGKDELDRLEAAIKREAREKAEREIEAKLRK